MRKRELAARVDKLIDAREEAQGAAVSAYMELATSNRRAAAARTALTVLRREVRELQERPDPIRDHLLRHRIIVNLRSGGSLRGICLAITPEFIHLDKPEWIPEGKESAEGQHDYPGFVDRANVSYFLLDR